MLSRLSSNFLLKSVIAMLAGAVVVALAISAFEAWQGLGIAARLAAVSETSALSFRAMHNLRLVRSFVVRALNGDGVVEPAQATRIGEARGAGTRALEAALAVLPRVDIPDRDVGQAAARTVAGSVQRAGR